MSRRPELVAFAAMLADLGANPCDLVERQRYFELVAPGEAPARATEIATMSGCALVCRGILRAFIQHPILDAPYRTGRAMADLIGIAVEAGALHGPERVPEPGDLVVVGGGADGGGPEHVWIALTVDVEAYDETTATARGIDGGQRDGQGFQVIREREHLMGAGHDQAHDDGAPGGAPRKVRWVIDVEAVLDRFGR